MNDMKKQSKKHTLGLSGEFLVAGELLRRGVIAAVTYGNAKKADVIAVSGESALSIEVKTTSESRWVLGGQIPKADSSIWVLVHLPANLKESPEFFILSGKELHSIILPEHEAYLSRYREKHGKEFTGRGVVSVKRKLIDDNYIGAWNKISERLGINVWTDN